VISFGHCLGKLPISLHRAQQLKIANQDTLFVLRSPVFLIPLIPVLSQMIEPVRHTGATVVGRAPYTCPQGTAYTLAGDGCAGAQDNGSVRRPDYFWGFINGVVYPTRPPWNVAGVDYAVGYSGTLKDPSVPNSLPLCVEGSGNTRRIDADVQPCVLDHFDFSLNGGYCFKITGANRNTVVFSNDLFSHGPSNCTEHSGWIFIDRDTKANILVQDSEFDDNYSSHSNGAITTSGDGDITVSYSAALGITGRLENVNNGATGSITNKYNYVEGIGNGEEHGEIVEINTKEPYVYNENWNNYYASDTNCCDTALLYITSGAPGPQGPGLLLSATASYNVLIARANPTQKNEVTVSAPIWVDTTFTNDIETLAVDNNYIDPSGSYHAVFVYPPNDTGSIGAASCVGNTSLKTGLPIKGTFGSKSSVLVCR